MMLISKIYVRYCINMIIIQITAVRFSTVVLLYYYCMIRTMQLYRQQLFVVCNEIMLHFFPRQLVYSIVLVVVLFPLCGYGDHAPLLFHCCSRRARCRQG